MENKRKIVYPITNYSKFLEEGHQEFQELFQLQCRSEYNISDFLCLKTLGTGAFGKVVLAKSKLNEGYSAIKIFQKSQIVKLKLVKNVITEKQILQSLNHPFTVHLEYSFQDNSYLYMGLPLVSGGEMFVHIRSMAKFEEPLARFYGAQVALALEYLHYSNMIFRDLKPENILIGSNGYIKLTDFGFCKVIDGRTYTICGTPEFLAPEIVLSTGYGKAVDWWSFGVLLFEMVVGFPPFMAKDPIKLFRKALACRYAVPPFVSPELEDLISNLIVTDLSRRYGNLKDGVEDIKNHRWFQTIDWLSLLNGQVVPPFVPTVTGAEDTRNFDKYKKVNLHINKKNQFGDLFDDF